jgi:outer membrane protein TolC
MSSGEQLRFGTFQDVLRYADKNAVDLQRSIIGEQIARHERNEALSALLPSGMVSLGYTDNIEIQPTIVPMKLFDPSAPDNAYEDFTFGARYNWSGGMMAQWDIVNVQRIFAYQTASLNVKESGAATRANRYTTSNALASTYYSILLTRESIRINRENVSTAESILAGAIERFDEGVITQAEVNRARIKRLQTQQTFRSTEYNYDQLTTQLQMQLNTTDTIAIDEIPGTLVLEDTTVSGVHPEVLLEQARAATRLSMLKQARAMLLPTLSVKYQNSRIWTSDSFMDQSDAHELPQQSFGISLNFQGLLNYSTSQRIKQSKLRLQSQLLQLDNTRLAKQKEDWLLLQDLKQTARQLDDQKQILELQKQNDSQAEIQYQGGIISLDQRLDIYDDLLSAQDHYLQRLAAFTLAQYKLLVRQISSSFAERS